MATITVSTNITNSTADTAALTLGGWVTRVNLLPNVGIFNYGTGIWGAHQTAFWPAARTPSSSTATCSR